LKRLEDWVIGLKNNLFFRARFRLTLFYLAVIAVLLIISSLVIYQRFISEITDELEGDFPSEHVQDIIVAKEIRRLRDTILFTDGTILFLIGGLAFWLAGKTLKPIQRTLEAQKRFTADASHELRTPLAIMKTTSEVTLRGKADVKQYTQALSSNLEEVDRMNQIVENLLSLSRMDTSEENFHLSRIDLSQLVSRSIGKINSCAAIKNIQLLQVASETIFVMGDAYKLQQAFFNVLKNAIDYSNNNGKIEVSIKRCGDKAEVAIADNGIGISAKDLPHIFDRFFRADKSRSQKARGSGLGLSITKWVIQKHHGNIIVQSSLGHGTVVTVSLPAFKIPNV
jgi:two-component system sensor histidine kinase CiaH